MYIKKSNENNRKFPVLSYAHISLTDVELYSEYGKRQETEMKEMKNKCLNLLY